MRKSRSFTLRDAGEKDADAIKNIVDSVASEKWYVVPESSQEDWDKTMREIRDRKGRVIVAEVDNKTVEWHIWSAASSRRIDTLRSLAWQF